MIRRLYPNGKQKAFNLNSGSMKQEFEWTHPCGMIVKRLPENVVVDLYREQFGT